MSWNKPIYRRPQRLPNIASSEQVNKIIAHSARAHLIDFRDKEYTVRVGKTIQEATPLLEAGFDYVTEIDGLKLFRKPK